MSDPIKPERRHFFAMTEELLTAEDLDPRLRQVIAAIGVHDWGNGLGCKAANGSLARLSDLSRGSKDGGKRSFLRLVKTLIGLGYLGHFDDPANPKNKTGRVLYLTEKTWRMVYKTDVGWVTPRSPEQTNGCHPSHKGGDAQVTPPGDAQVTQIDSGLTDPGIDPSGGDLGSASRKAKAKTGKATVRQKGDESPRPYPRLDPAERPAAIERLRKQVQRELRFGSPNLAPTLAAIPALLEQADGQVPDLITVVAETLRSAGKAKQPGAYLAKILATAIRDGVESKRVTPAREPTSEQTTEANRQRRRDAVQGHAADAKLESDWQELSSIDQQDIGRKVIADRPDLAGPGNWRRQLRHALCLDEMDRRFAPSPTA